MATTNPAESAEWDVRTENQTVVVELPPELTLDEETSKQINEQFAAATARPGTTRVLTLLRVENSLATGVFEELKTGADLAASNGIERWAIAVETKIKGMAFESKLDDLQTEVFDDEDAAREWLA